MFKAGLQLQPGAARPGCRSLDRCPGRRKLFGQRPGDRCWLEPAISPGGLPPPLRLYTPPGQRAQTPRSRPQCPSDWPARAQCDQCRNGKWRAASGSLRSKLPPALRRKPFRNPKAVPQLALGAIAACRGDIWCVSSCECRATASCRSRAKPASSMTARRNCRPPSSTRPTACHTRSSDSGSSPP